MQVTGSSVGIGGASSAVHHGPEAFRGLRGMAIIAPQFLIGLADCLAQLKRSTETLENT